MQKENNSVDTEFKWYAIYTKPRNEKKVAKELSKKGIENFFPLYITVRQWSDRKKKVEVPLFNSYIFVKPNQKEYYEALNTIGVVKYVSFEGKAVAIPEKQIMAIRQILAHKIEFELSMLSFKRGEKVKIQYGVMTDLEGEIIEIDKQEKFLIRIDAIGYSFLLKISQDKVLKI